MKPANLVVDSQCRLKICDLGLSRHIADSLAVPEGEDAKFTDYVVTRWYRAPELLMGSKRYSTKVDTWAAGCMLALNASCDFQRNLRAFVILRSPTPQRPTVGARANRTKTWTAPPPSGGGRASPA